MYVISLNVMEAVASHMKKVPRVFYSKHSLYMENKIYELEEGTGNSPNDTRIGWSSLDTESRN